MPKNQPDTTTRRLIRMETKLSKLMTHLGCDPMTGEPLHHDNAPNNGDQSGDTPPVETGTRWLGTFFGNKG